MFEIIVTKKAMKEFPNLTSARLDKKAKLLLELLKVNPFQNPPPYEKLVGDMEGLYSRRINQQHRLVYAVDETNGVVKILSAWTHYESMR